MTREQWFIRLDGDDLGPLSIIELRDLARRGIITVNTPVSADQAEWQHAANLSGLFGWSDGLRTSENPSLRSPAGSTPPKPERVSRTKSSGDHANHVRESKANWPLESTTNQESQATSTSGQATSDKTSVLYGPAGSFVIGSSIGIFATQWGWLKPPAGSFLALSLAILLLLLSVLSIIKVSSKGVTGVSRVFNVLLFLTGLVSSLGLLRLTDSAKMSVATSKVTRELMVSGLYESVRTNDASPQQVEAAAGAFKAVIEEQDLSPEQARELVAEHPALSHEYRTAIQKTLRLYDL